MTTHHLRTILFTSVSALGLLVACGAGDGERGGGGASSNSGDGDGDGDGDGGLNLGGDSGDGDGGGPKNKPPAVLVPTLPDGFTQGDYPEDNPGVAGGYMVVGKLEDLELEASNSCVNVLRVVARDFTQAHVDFGIEKPSTFASDGLNGHYVGQVAASLDMDTRKPTVSSNPPISGVIDHFDDWYVNTPGVNIPYVMDMWLEPVEGKDGYFAFDMVDFFPLDDVNENPNDVQPGNRGNHNFLFTTEIHTAFEYKGGEVFNFRGDDDVWVYINNVLVVDLGGIHGPIVGNVDLDSKAMELGLKVGETYNLDMFQAERNPGGSNFRIETSLDFKECGVLDNDIIR